jgi:hypothetical protein
MVWIIVPSSLVAIVYTIRCYIPVMIF